MFFSGSMDILEEKCKEVPRIGMKKSIELTNSFCLFLKFDNGIYEFKFFLTIYPEWGFCLVILQKKNVADVFQRFHPNANVNLNLHFYFNFFILYRIFLLIYLFLFCICNFLLKRFTSWLDLLYF